MLTFAVIERDFSTIPVAAIRVLMFKWYDVGSVIGSIRTSLLTELSFEKGALGSWKGILANRLDVFGMLDKQLPDVGWLEGCPGALLRQIGSPYTNTCLLG
jgi:hypothetical protein